MNNTSSTRRSSLRAGLAVAALAAGLASPLAFARGHFVGETVIVAPPVAQVG
jgi:hypothetical protein